MAKYIIDIPDNQINDYIAPSDDMIFRIPTFKRNGTFSHFVMSDLNLIPYIEPDRKEIEDEVWEFVKKIECLTVGETEGCFDVEYDGIPFVANMFSYQEAKEKYEAWKEQEEQIRVGDEVKHKENGWKAFVTNITNTGCLTLMWDLGKASCWYNPEDFEKTGKHCAEVEELIKKIKENS